MKIRDLLSLSNRVHAHKRSIHQAYSALECIRGTREYDVRILSEKLVALEQSHVRMQLAMSNVSELENKETCIEAQQMELATVFKDIKNVVKLFEPGHAYFRLRTKGKNHIVEGHSEHRPIVCKGYSSMMNVLLDEVAEIPPAIVNTIVDYCPVGYVEMIGSSWRGQEASASIYIVFNFAEIKKKLSGLHKFKIFSSVAPHIRVANTYSDWRRIRELRSKLKLRHSDKLSNHGHEGEFVVYQALNNYTGNIWSISKSARDQKHMDAFGVFRVPSKIFDYVQRRRWLDI